MSRVVITAMGAVTPIGNDIESFWNSIKAGKHGMGIVTRFDVTENDVKVAAEIKGFEPLLALEKRELRNTDL